MVELIALGITIKAGDSILVEDATLTVEPGELVALVGPNGAGKSNLLRALVGINVPPIGTVTVNAQPLHTISPAERARLLSYLPQQRSMAWPLTVEDVVALGRYAWGGVPGKLSTEDHKAVQDALIAVDMVHMKERRTDTLSGGEMARTHLARSLASETPLIIADEPLAALDPLHQWQSMQVFANYVAHGGGALVVMHDLALAARFATRLVWMDKGRIVANGSARETMTADRLASIYGVRAHIEDGIPHIEGVI